MEREGGRESACKREKKKKVIYIAWAVLSNSLPYAYAK